MNKRIKKFISIAYYSVVLFLSLNSPENYEKYLLIGLFGFLYLINDELIEMNGK